MTYGLRLAEAVWGTLQDALAVYADDRRATGHLRQQLGRLEEPVRLAVAGPWRSGKSTVINAVMGEEVAPLGVEPAGRAFVWYEDGPQPRATAYPVTGPAQELTVAKSAAGLRIDPVGWPSGEVEDVVVRWPTRALRQATLIDTPAVDDPDGNRPSPVLDRVLRDADAVLYLTRDGRDTDLRALEPVRDSAVGQAAPVNVLLVLSRADEVGGGRVDALLTAQQLARRQRRDQRVAACCVDAVAVSGVVGLAGRVMSESDFTALAALADADRVERDAALLTADRFLRANLPRYLDAPVRAALLDRFGLFGLRLASTLIRSGADSRARLSAELIRRSGLAELRTAVARYFIERTDVLKARSALLGLESLARTARRPGSAELL
ncbi:dynamin family protein, partial [Micromonospora zhanjiangensis]